MDLVCLMISYIIKSENKYNNRGDRVRKFFFDIETLPAEEDKHEILEKLYEKKKEKNSKFQKTLEEYLEETNFGGAFGRIFCISYAIDDGEVDSISGDEKEMLEKFWQIAKDIDKFVGHNILDFDLKFIMQRSIILKVKPSRDISFRKYTNSDVYDIMHEWTKWGREGVAMDALAHAMGIPSSKEGGIDGSQVHEFYKAGKGQEIIDYCSRDVGVTRKIYKRMNFEE